MFQKDDFVYYAAGGVCRVADIQYAPLDNMPADRQYYILCSVHDTNGLMYVPVDSEAVFLRRLLTREEAQKLVEEIPELCAFEEPNAKALRARYVESMRTHEPREWVRVIKTVTARMRALAETSRTQRLSETERGYAEDAKRFLFAELSLALQIPLAEMEPFIRRHMEQFA